MINRLIVLGICLGLSGCATIPATQDVSCASAPMIGSFNPATDIFIGHFDSKPDVDDLHTIAAVGSVLKRADYACVRAIGVSGAYGVQGGEFIESPELFDLAFGANWLDGHNNREQTLDRHVELIVETLEAGGHVWIMIAGQADIAADAVSRATALAPDLPYRSHVHLVQHSDWNESVTDPDKLAFAKRAIDYIKIPDGNAFGNGSPGYTTHAPDLWPKVLADPDIGPLWRAAKTLADEKNPTAAYVNPNVVSGGFDFSDTAEMAYVFGFNAASNVPFFFDYVLSEHRVKWPNGARAALALTYDDALQSQIDTALPQLESVGLTGTFYLSMAMQNFSTQREHWEQAAAAGHELGNHTVVHPCRASLPDRAWVSANRDLDTYTKAQLLEELETANVLLTEIDGQSVRSFAYTCGDTQVGGEPFVEDLRPLFPGARSVEQYVGFDTHYVPSFAVDQTPAAEMIDYVDALIARQAIGTITFHGIGGDHLSITAEDHLALLKYLKSREADIWVAPLKDILQARDAHREE